MGFIKTIISLYHSVAFYFYNIEKIVYIVHVSADSYPKSNSNVLFVCLGPFNEADRKSSSMCRDPSGFGVYVSPLLLVLCSSK